MRFCHDIMSPHGVKRNQFTGESLKLFTSANVIELIWSIARTGSSWAPRIHVRRPTVNCATPVSTPPPHPPEWEGWWGGGGKPVIPFSSPPNASPLSCAYRNARMFSKSEWAECGGREGRGGERWGVEFTKEAANLEFNTKKLSLSQVYCLKVFWCCQGQTSAHFDTYAKETIH